jgi:hypothetical protein
MQYLTTEGKAKMMALPLIELDENDHNDTDIILKGIKDVFSTMGLPFMGEFCDDSKYYLDFSHKDSNLVHVVHVTYNSEQRFILLTTEFNNVPKHKRKKMFELINLLNLRFPHSCTVMTPDGNVAIKSVMPLSRWFNTRELFIHLEELLLNGICYAGTGTKVIISNITPASVIELLDKYVQEHQPAE